MIYLILAILCSVTISLVMRASEKYCKGSTVMLASNYVVCSVFALIMSGGNAIPAADGISRTLLMGGVNGCFYLSGLLLTQWNISQNGVILTTTFSRLGVLVPTLASVFLFREYPNAWQVGGFALAIGAICLMQGKNDKNVGSMAGLFTLLAVGGTGEVMSKLYEEWGATALKNQFLLYTFFTALVLCVVLCIVRKEKITWKAALFGVGIGLPNYLSARFLLLALGEIPAVVAYPTNSAANIVLLTAAGMLFFSEKLAGKKKLAMILILAALVLLNIG